ncbi:hypothetical protein HMPREF0908_1056 [Selenomonas flueggei ATCC 43531]|uniref:Uncharacterized protein n=1 Tax=Selenomonas flueggei ATCC 43531 TaxID=638302 RepID=C4V3G2_9FIRM|nr:hypothetical protein HMPREF0908_1056 [Selenomonas flueggei ATCC 43531]
MGHGAADLGTSLLNPMGYEEKKDTPYGVPFLWNHEWINLLDGCS